MDPKEATSNINWARPFLIIPLVLVNAAAIWGQAGWAYNNITDQNDVGVVIAILFALAVESIGVYLAIESYEALMADQSSGMLRFSSYAVGAFAGVLNYLHFVNHNPTQAITFGVMSAISPWLWGVWSRARNRTRLAELDMVDARGVKLSTIRKVLHPGKSFEVIKHAAWEGITNPHEAIASWEGKDKVQPTTSIKLNNTNTPEQIPTITLELNGNDNNNNNNNRHESNGHKTRRPREEMLQLIKQLETRNPGITQAEIASKLGVTDRRVRQITAK